ncbi:MAG: deoxyribose-phosphate aldolase [Mangrovibacterium sp.]
MINISEKLEQIKLAASKNNTAEMQKLAFSCIDLTTLNHTDTKTSVAQFTQRVNDFAHDYPQYPHVAAICIHPNMVATVKSTLNVDGVNIAAVASGFPASQTFLSIKTMESVLATENGADEIDIVLALSNFLDDNLEDCLDEIELIKESIAPAHLKVILESGTLHEEDLIYKASKLAIRGGADFIKTSTGKTTPAATPQAAIVMCLAIKDHYVQTGKKIGFKPAGGISTTEDAILFLTIVQTILGDEWMNPKLFRIGASRLANNLLSDLTGEQISYF